MKPYLILLFLVSVFLFLFFITVLFPKNGIYIGDHIHLRFTNIDDLIKRDTVKYADITRIIENYKADLEIEEPEDTSKTIEVEDTTRIGNIVIEQETKVELKDTIAILADSLKNLTYPIELPPLNPTVLYPVFKDLHYLKKTKTLIRLLHYGDSQIEGDRITSFLRNKIQTLFGGSGCGLLPPVPMDHGLISFRQKYSPNWVRYAAYNNEVKIGRHLRYGALLSFAGQAETNPGKLTGTSSWLSFSPTKMGYRNSRLFNKVSLFLTNTTDTIKLKVRVQKSIIDTRILPPNQGLTEINWEFKKVPKELIFSFEGKGKPEIYGISFDNNWGVAVDNIPLRGSSGLVFSKTDTAFLNEMYKKLNVRMLILQFGGNIVPLRADDYSFYERYFRRELNVLKNMLPGVPVIVIGPSDMSLKEKDSYITYPNLTKVRDALKNATFDSGYAFWDMYEAMGGENSMPSWVNADPPLAVPDFVHFNTRGTKIIAEMFYNAFLLEYNKWLSESSTN